MKNRIIQIISAVICLLVFTVPVCANSAMTFWEGTDAAGVVTTDGDCPIEVLHEDLVFTLTDYSEDNQADKDRYTGDIMSTFSAEYTFYNPSDEAVSVLLSFPLGKLNAKTNGKDDDRYSVEVNGEKADCTVRYTYINNRQFDTEKDLSLLEDSYTEDTFWKPDLPVYLYTFAFEFKEAESEIPAVMCTLPNEPARRRYQLNNLTGGSFMDDFVSLRCSLYGNEEEKTAQLFVFGENLDSLPQWDPDNETGEFDSKLVSRETMTFKDYILSGFDETDGISETDYYNAEVSMINDTMESPAVVGTYQNLQGSLLCWLQYSIGFEPGESVVNKVAAPAYPSVDMSYESNIYGYTYLLTPASTWKKFGDLDIRVLTDRFIISSSPGRFEKTDEGYALHFDSLPEDDLLFNVCSMENPKRRSNSSGIILALLMALAAIPVILVIVILYFIIRAIRRRKHSS